MDKNILISFLNQERDHYKDTLQRFSENAHKNVFATPGDITIFTYHAQRAEAAQKVLDILKETDDLEEFKRRVTMAVENALYFPSGSVAAIQVFNSVLNTANKM